MTQDPSFGPPPMVVRAVSDADAGRWVEKGQARAERLLRLAGGSAQPCTVAAVTVADSRCWPFGNFMIGWLDRAPEVRLVCRVPEVSFFLQLLGVAYGPVLARRPDLAGLLADDTRLEMSVTNDVLQIQLDELEQGYSMVRHHALMLFFAACWLEEPRCSQWFALYDEVLSYVDASADGRPGLADLERTESTAFADSVALAPRTLLPRDAQELLADDEQLSAVCRYQLCAAAAVGLLWRQFRGLGAAEQEDWERDQLRAYQEPGYLMDAWAAGRPG